MQSAVYVRAVRGNWPLIAVLVLCGGIGLGFLAHSKDPVYTSEARLLVTFTPAPERPSPQTSRLMQRVVKTYTSLLATPRLTEPVIDTLGLDTTPRGLDDQITASSPLDTHEIHVTVTDTNAVRAAAVANALVTELAKVAARAKPSTELPANTGISVVHPASVPGEPEPVRWPLHGLGGGLAGFGIGLGLAVLRGRRYEPGETGVPVSR
jgi:capsular polysaccharide biosynthesis protein